jgi:Domain of unknown function (DUF5076)
MPKHPGELPIPPVAEKAHKGFEIARIWAARGGQHVTIRTETWEDPAAWGIMLVDLARHVANAYAEDEGMDAEAALERIREGFDAEWGHPTDEPKLG